MRLTVECIGLVEGDVVAAAREIAQEPAVIRRGAVPVGRQQAGAVERDLHAGTASFMLRTFPPSAHATSTLMDAGEISKRDHASRGMPSHAISTDLMMSQW